MKMLQSRHTNNPHTDKCNCGLTRYTGKRRAQAEIRLRLPDRGADRLDSR